MHHHIKQLIAIALITVAMSLFILSCKRQPAHTGIQPNTIQEFKFQGGTLKDGKIKVDPDVKVEPGQTKNTLTLRRPNGTGMAVSCFCVVEGGDCWAVHNPIGGGPDIFAGCASTGCGGGGEPFCFMDMSDGVTGFNIRFSVRSWH